MHFGQRRQRCRRQRACISEHLAHPCRQQQHNGDHAGHDQGVAQPERTRGRLVRKFAALIATTQSERTCGHEHQVRGGQRKPERTQQAWRHCASTPRPWSKGLLGPRTQEISDRVAGNVLIVRSSSGRTVAPPAVGRRLLLLRRYFLPE